uniref:Uncharacterized protein n=1 Tax=viral metagenome TaxID=1070528 RepID=A0A6C0C9K7_9ZZZZ
MIFFNLGTSIILTYYHLQMTKQLPRFALLEPLSSSETAQLCIPQFGLLEPLSSSETTQLCLPRFAELEQYTNILTDPILLIERVESEEDAIEKINAIFSAFGKEKHVDFEGLECDPARNDLQKVKAAFPDHIVTLREWGHSIRFY